MRNNAQWDDQGTNSHSIMRFRSILPNLTHSVLVPQQQTSPGQVAAPLEVPPHHQTVLQMREDHTIIQ